MAVAMSADRGCSMEHTMGYRGVGRFSRGKGGLMGGVEYKGSKGPGQGGQRKDGETEPTGPAPAPAQSFTPAGRCPPVSLVHLKPGPPAPRPTSRPHPSSGQPVPSPVLITLVVTHFNVTDLHLLLESLKG